MSYGEIKKPWGYERLIEKNRRYVLKELFMKKDCMCSLQFHKKKHETFYVVSGKMNFFHGFNRTNLSCLELKSGDSYVIPPKYVHRMAALEDTLYLEASTPEIHDVIRLEDVYGR